MQLKHTIFILSLFALLSSCDDKNHDFEHYRANFLAYVIPDAFDTIVAKQLNEVEIQKTIEQIVSMTENTDYEVYGYSFTSKISHLDKQSIEMEKNGNQYKSYYIEIDFKYNDSHGLFATKSRHHQGGMAKNEDAEKVHYVSVKENFYGGTMLDFVIYFKGKDDVDFKKRTTEDKKRFKKDRNDRKIYHLDWSKIYDKKNSFE